MRKEYDFRGGERGKFYGKVNGHRVIKNTSEENELGEALSLLKRVRPHLKETPRAEKLREQIEEFLERA
jgi:hypothetical protein